MDKHVILVLPYEFQNRQLLEDIKLFSAYIDELLLIEDWEYGFNVSFSDIEDQFIIFGFSDIDPDCLEAVNISGVKENMISKLEDWYAGINESKSDFYEYLKSTLKK